MCAKRAWLGGLILLLVPVLAAGSRPLSWTVTQSEHFELYSQLDDHRSQQLINWFEQLRPVFLSQSILKFDAIPKVRVIVFASAKEYEPYRVRPFSDGSYAHTGDRHYITMFAGTNERRVAAHEFAHCLLSSAGATVPLWLNEGLAEFFSTVRIGEGSSEIGSDFAEHSQTLAGHRWIPLPELLDPQAASPLRADRERAAIFYAENWLLTDMLILSPQYRPQFQAMFSSLRSGLPASNAFLSAYGRSIEEIEAGMHAWLRKRAEVRPIIMAGRSTPAVNVHSSDLSGSAVRAALADMLAAAGELDRAESMLRDLAREEPQDARIPAALGAIALQKGNEGAARAQWKQAIAEGLPDADIAYRYALLADAAGLPQDELRAALERAVSLRPDFDDARYKLALLEKNAGHFDAAIAQFRAMRSVDPARAFVYWTAMADAFNELGRRDEAVDAARKAGQHARTPGERAWAENLAYVAQTDLAVQFARDASGRAEMITTRVPHQSAADWNPFIEAGDDVRSVSGILREIDCSGPATRFRVDSSGAVLTLEIADPTRVRMRNAPDELVCGPQQGVTVEVQYAASKKESQDGLIRGIDFRASPAAEK